MSEGLTIRCPHCGAVTKRTARYFSMFTPIERHHGLGDDSFYVYRQRCIRCCQLYEVYLSSDAAKVYKEDTNDPR